MLRSRHIACTFILCALWSEQSTAGGNPAAMPVPRETPGWMKRHEGFVAIAKMGDSDILLLGDSITDAFRKPEELNPGFQLGNGYAFLAAARLAVRCPEYDFQFFNRARSGNRVADLLHRWEADALSLAPDIASILAGVNEALRNAQELMQSKLGGAMGGLKGLGLPGL